VQWTTIMLDIGSFRMLSVIACFALSTVACSSSDEANPGSDPKRTERVTNDVLLVHGAWADGSCWTNVAKQLFDAGFSVRAVQLREQSVADDAALVRRAVDAAPGPLIVAGHSYGGFVISEATAGAQNVPALVFLSAFAPDEGESLGMLTAEYPTTPAIQNLVVDEHGDSTIEPSAFIRYFASDLPESDARVLAAVQHPTAVGILGAIAGEPGWRSIPSYYQVSTDDQVIDPALQRKFAERMHAETIELKASHVALISQPRPVADLIARAAALAAAK
jgi:pimeloyl-ACP methyl ester carboxylesterase